jgi:hypothetical protein
MLAWTVFYAEKWIKQTRRKPNVETSSRKPITWKKPDRKTKSIGG